MKLLTRSRERRGTPYHAGLDLTGVAILSVLPKCPLIRREKNIISQLNLTIKVL